MILKIAYTLNALNKSAYQIHTCKCTLSSYFKSYWNKVKALKVIIGLCEDQVKTEVSLAMYSSTHL